MADLLAEHIGRRAVARSDLEHVVAQVDLTNRPGEDDVAHHPPPLVAATRLVRFVHGRTVSLSPHPARSIVTDGDPRRARTAPDVARTRADRPPPAPGRRVGDARRLLLRRPAAPRARGRAATAGSSSARSDPTTGQTMYRADWVGEVLPGAERPLRRRGVGHRARSSSGEMLQAHGAERVRRHRDPRASRRRARRCADSGVVAHGRAPAGRARAHLPRDLRALRPDDQRGRVPDGRRSARAHRRCPASATA